MKTTDNSTENGGPDLHRVGQCLYRSQKSRRYYAILKRGGKQIKKSLKTTDFALAKRKLNELEKKAAHLAHGGESSISFKDLAERWVTAISPQMKTSTLRRQEGIVKLLCKRFGPTPARSVTRQMVEEWAAERSKEIAARTFNYEREGLVRILDYAVREGLMLDNPGRVVQRRKLGQKQLMIPTRKQFSALLKAIHGLRADAQAAADLCELLAYSGCRLGEATAMKWGDVDFKRKQFVVTGGETGTKNHEVRVVPLFPALERLLLRLRDERETLPGAEERISTIENAKRAIESACRNGDLPHFTHHSLRHFFCSNAIEAGVDFKAIAGWLGHKDGGLLVAKTYGHLRDEHSAAMAERMTFEAVTDE